MKTCIARLKSASAYSQSRAHVTEKLNDKESADDFEKRTWREKVHVNDDGFITIPGMGIKMAIDKAASFLGMKVPGKRNATYTKHFLAGVLVLDDAPIALKKAEVEPEWLYVNSDGVRGSGKRVWKCFPLIREWTAQFTFFIADDTITKDVFEQHLKEAGKFIGLGRFRPEKGGFKGRFEVVSTEWSMS